jgi:hypothetical protein
MEMHAYMIRLKEASKVEGMQLWDIRIGIHTGTVVAGVVGIRNFLMILGGYSKYGKQDGIIRRSREINISGILMNS